MGWNRRQQKRRWHDTRVPHEPGRRIIGYGAPLLRGGNCGLMVPGSGPINL